MCIRTGCTPVTPIHFQANHRADKRRNIEVFRHVALISYVFISRIFGKNQLFHVLKIIQRLELIVNGLRKKTDLQRSDMCGFRLLCLVNQELNNRLFVVKSEGRNQYKIFIKIGQRRRCIPYRPNSQATIGSANGS